MVCDWWGTMVAEKRLQKSLTQSQIELNDDDEKRRKWLAINRIYDTKERQKNINTNSQSHMHDVWGCTATCHTYTTYNQNIGISGYSPNWSI